MLHRIIHRLFIWSLDREIAHTCDFPPHNLYQVIEREVKAIAESIASAAEWHWDEVKILTDRLTRRYDVGMAMNEATQRAQESRKAAGLRPDGEFQMSEKQKAALKFQAEYLRRVQGL